MRFIRLRVLLSCILILGIIAACGPNNVPTPTTLPPNLPAPPILGIPRPRPTQREGFLASIVPEHPIIILVTTAMSQNELANLTPIAAIDDLEVNTTLKLIAKLLILRYANPMLPEVIPGDTLVAIPQVKISGFNSKSLMTNQAAKPIFLISSKALRIDDITKRLNVTVEKLIETNPQLGERSQIAADEILLLDAIESGTN